jgi:hypothetical protein
VVLLVREVLGMVPGDLRRSSVSQWLTGSSWTSESGLRWRSRGDLGDVAADRETRTQLPRLRHGAMFLSAQRSSVHLQSRAERGFVRCNTKLACRRDTDARGNTGSEAKAKGSERNERRADEAGDASGGERFEFGRRIRKRGPRPW